MRLNEKEAYTFFSQKIVPNVNMECFSVKPSEVAQKIKEEEKQAKAKPEAVLSLFNPKRQEDKYHTLQGLLENPKSSSDVCIQA